MKRCPQCAFVYEDDQNFCDMDGETLVHDAVSLPLPPPGVMQPNIPPPRSHSKSFLTLVLSGILIAAIVLLAYYRLPGSLGAKPGIPVAQPGSHNAKPGVSPTPDMAPAAPRSLAQPSRDTHPDSVSQNVKPVQSVPAESDQGPALETPSRNRSLNQKPVGTTVSQKQGRVIPSQKPVEVKKDSRLMSIIKKTGNIIKRPFNRN